MTADELVTSIVEKLAEKMKDRINAEAKVVHNEDTALNIFEQLLDTEPYYTNDGQFCGGIQTLRFVSQTDSTRRISFVFDSDDKLMECVEWTPFQDYPYPL